MPTAAAQPGGSQGGHITRLTKFGRSLYPSYGDYGQNTGPIDLVALDLDTGLVGASEISAHTEQFWTMRVIGGKLYAPYIDPQSTNADPSNGQYAVATAPGSWSVVTSVLGVSHAFDFAETADGLWVFGASETENAADIWRSTDGGVTWAESLSVPGDGLTRFYAVAAFGDELIAFATVTPAARAWRWTAGGTEWVEITDPGEVTEVKCLYSLNEVDFWITLHDGKETGFVTAGIAPLAVTLDPADAATIQASLPAGVLIADADTDGTHLWLLAGDQQVWRGDTSGSWTSVMTIDDQTARCLAVDLDGGFIYFGTNDSRILRTAIPA